MESNDDTAVGLRMSSRQKKPSRRILEGDDNEKIPKKISHCLLENDYWYESSSQSPKKRALQDGARASSKRPRTAVTDSAAALSTTEQPIADLHQDAILALTEMSKLTPVNCEEEANDSKSATAPTTTKNWWSAAEDEKLRQLIAKEDKIAKMEHGDVRWTNVAKALGGGRTSKQCRERFANHLRSNLVKGNWSASEDQLLFQLQSIHGNSWATIRKHMPHRAENDIKNRWYSDQRAKKRALRRGEGEEEGPKKQKKKQTKQTKPVASVSKVAAAEARKSLPEEPVGPAASLNVTSPTNDAPTEAIVEEKPSQILWAPSGRQGAVVLSTLDGTPLVLLEGVQTDVSELFRTGAIQATSLFGTQHAKKMTTTVNADASTTETPTPTKLLPPAHKYSRWTDEEDDVLRKAVDNQGTPPIDWLQISRNYFRGMRTAQQCKNRWKKCLMPGLRRAPWTEEENAIIMRGMKAGLKWTEIAKKLDGRISEQVRDHWNNQLDPTLKKDPWTEEEIEALFRYQAQLGNKWSEIAKRLPGRSENAIKNRWHNAKVSQRRKMKRMAKESQMAEVLHGSHLGVELEKAA